MRLWFQVLFTQLHISPESFTVLRVHHALLCYRPSNMFGVTVDNAYSKREGEEYLSCFEVNKGHLKWWMDEIKSEW